MRINASALYSALRLDLSREIDPQVPTWGPDSTDKQVACYVLMGTLLKKFTRTGKPTPEACAAAMEKFLAVNERCRRWSIPYEFSVDEQLIGGIKSALHDFWTHPEPCVSSFNQLFFAGRTGTGASIKARGSDFYTKIFDSPLTATGDLHFVWERMCEQAPLWSEASRLQKLLRSSYVVESSNYSFVNKTTTIARGTCTEPTVNMWFQLGFGEMLNDRLRKVYNYDPALQPDRNRVMARRGSIDGSLCTIDLESASDSIALHVLEEILPRDFLTWLKILRCRETTLPQGEKLELSMVSTMGNGFTFPLQTLIFYSVVKSAYTLLGIPLKRGKPGSEGFNPFDVDRNFSVFGDDIIVDRRAVRLVLRGLYLLGFVVNADKTFVEGPFRESCGADYMRGTNVRGVYIKSLNTQQDVIVAINTLNRWSAKTSVSLSETVGVLLKGIHNPSDRFVPAYEDDAAGIHVPEQLTGDRNPWYTKVLTDKQSRSLVNSQVTVRPYRAYVPIVKVLKVCDGYIELAQGEKERYYNPSGLMLAFLSGNLRGGEVTLRQRNVTYVTKHRETPSWGVTVPRPLEFPLGSDEDRLFVEACIRNLSVPGLERVG